MVPLSHTRVLALYRKRSVSQDHSLTVSVSGTMAERPWQVGQLPVAGRKASSHPMRWPVSKPGGPVPLPGARWGSAAGVRPAGWTRPAGPRMGRSAGVGACARRRGPPPGGPGMGRSAFGAATAHHRPAAERSGAGLDRYRPGKRSGPPRGSVAGLAGQISSGQIGVGGPGGQFGADRAAGAARGGQFRWSACWSVRSRR